MLVCEEIELLERELQTLEALKAKKHQKVNLLITFNN